MTRIKIVALIGILVASVPSLGSTALSAQTSDHGAVVAADRETMVELYVTSWCPHCHRAQKYLKERGVPFVIYDVEKEYNAAQRMRELNPRGGVPVAVIGEEVLIGFAESAYARALQQMQVR